MELRNAVALARHGSERHALTSIAADSGFRIGRSVAAGAIEFGAMKASMRLNGCGEAGPIFGAAAIDAASVRQSSIAAAP